MIRKARSSAEFLKSKDDEDFGLFLKFASLKTLYRQGWIINNIPKEICESVADHNFGVILMSYILAKKYRPDLNLKRVMELAIIHEVGEIYAGDITPHDNISEEKQRSIELRGVYKVFDDKNDKEKYFSKLWVDVNYRKSPEGIFVKDIDKLEMACQALLYERMTNKKIPEFFNNAKKNIKTKEIKVLLMKIIDSRKGNK